MSALAAIFLQKGARVLGSDRSYDQGHTPQKFEALKKLGIELVPQDGAGLTSDIDALIVSSAVEDSIPDVAAAKKQGIEIRKRADLLAEIFNESETGISIAGTSGKSTVTGMVATALTHAALDPTVMNGGVIKNFESNMRVGASGVFVTETDESDGSIALYNPAIAVLNNVALDHKTLEELDELFGNFIARARRGAVLNFDDPKVKELAGRASVPVFSYAIEDDTATLTARNIKFSPASVSFDVHDSESDQTHPVNLQQPGAHNVSNALAALSVCKSLDVKMEQAIAGLEKFTGIGRRMDVIGTQNDITVIDDFGHNPDKIAASLKTLKQFTGRLIIIFQPHGFGPLKLMGREIAESFGHHMGEYDVLLMTEPFYAGGTVDRSVGAKDIVALVVAQNREALCFETREEILPFVQANAKPGDRIVVMGARDDSLTDFAREILKGL